MLGNVSKLKKLYFDSLDNNEEGDLNWTAVVSTATKYGHLNILRWVKSLNLTIDNKPLTQSLWRSQVPEIAARNFRLNILEWSSEHCPIHRFPSSVCAAAVSCNNLELIKWLKYKGAPWGPDSCIAAVKNNLTDLLIWLRHPSRKSEYGSICPWDTSVCSTAARVGNFKLIKKLRSSSSIMGVCPWDSWTCASAAENGHTKIIRWCRRRSCPWDNWTCVLAARGGWLTTLVWCRDLAKPCPADESTCVAAASGDHLDILIYLRTGLLSDKYKPTKYPFTPCPWDKRVPTAAVGAGSLRILDWSKQHGCFWDYFRCKQMAEANDNKEITVWLNTVGKNY